MLKSSYVLVKELKNKTVFNMQGAWILKNARFIAEELKKYIHLQGNIVFNFSKVEDFDTHGIVAFLSFKKQIEKNGSMIDIICMNEKLAKLFEVCEKNYTQKLIKPSKTNVISQFFYDIGLFSIQSKKTMIDFFSFVGGVFASLKQTILSPHKFRLKATLFHIQTSGVNALPIIFLTSFLIGIVIAFQGAVQLEKFGANIFIVEMVAISVTRELAPLLTAIVVAGRSSSSFTAQIGVMKITEEIDAMETMGFSAWNFLVLPRVIGLMISLPLLVFFADCVSIFGGMVVASVSLGISFEEFLLRMQESVELKHIYIGLLKAPIFGWIIAVIGCFRGFQISSSTQSVGKYTTISVVNAIFWVIAMDAIISVFLTELDL
ncbi:MAG TPA: hypothetical protein CFH82_09020 [Sulfurospirillum sp. UBA12182]|nr:MAG TPA: hypothetical protein CFH82_09020 [Sulfurospirillum sp. UBA12182]